MAGKWKLAAVDTRDTFHKTGQTWTNQRYAICLSYDGGIQLLQNYKEPVCKYCYELKNTGDTLELRLDESGLSPFCLEALQSSVVTVSKDSLVLVRQDSFVIKKSIYRRMNDDGTFKTN
jgi:RNase P subunit RPR2